MITKRLISRFSLAFIVLISLYLYSCEKEDWCSDCYQYDCRDIFYEKVLDIKTICADSKAECRDEIQRFHVEFYSSCWDCAEPYRK